MITKLCEVCIAVYFPLKHKRRNYRDYIIINNGDFPGLRDRFRAAILLKNRFGPSDVSVGLNFFGEIGLFKELPKGSEITNYTPYMELQEPKFKQVKDEQKEDEKTQIKFQF